MEDAARLMRRRRGRRGAIAGLLLVVALCGAASGQEADAGDLAASAREAAGRDDHAAALRDAAAAIAADPALENELDLLVAHQLTWSDRPAEAIPWYRKRLAHAPGDSEARLGLARALSWAGFPDSARAEYAALAGDEPGNVEAAIGVARMDAWQEDWPGAARGYRAALAIDPSSAEAQLGLADAQNRRGLHRDAESRYLARLEEDPSDAEARVGLAQARRWLGEEEHALRTLEGATSADAAELGRSIRADRGTIVEVSFAHWKDSDDQELDTVGAGAERGFGRGWRGVAAFAWARAGEPGSSDVETVRGSGGADWQPNRLLAFHARLAVLGVGRNLGDGESVPSGDGETVDGADVKRTFLLGEGWVTWTPRDRLRVDASFARGPIETPKALARGIRADDWGLGADWQFADRWVARAQSGLRHLTDGNDRVSGNAELENGEYRLVGGLAAWASAGVSAFRFDETPDHGYYAPERYDALWLGARARLPLGPRVTLEGDGRVSSEHESGDDRFGVLNGGLEARGALGGGFALAAFVRSSTSRFDTGAGYGRHGWGVTLSHGP